MRALKPLPIAVGVKLETDRVLRQLTKSHRQLAELKGAIGTIPNASILLDTLTLEEAKDSSAIENIITTHDELYRADVASGRFASPAAKEVHAYAAALRVGEERLRKTGLIRLDDVLAIQETLEGNRAGLRKLPGTVLKNEQTGEIIYEPPQHPNDVQRLMDNFIEHFNLSNAGGTDPLVQMAILHHQFESIHPFYDGNGRTGRILNLLYLVMHKLIDRPIMYLSRYIVRYKSDYYEGLQHVRTTGEWEPWIMYMLRAVEQTSHSTLQTVTEIRALMETTKARMRSEAPKIYSQELLENLFRHPYTKIEFVERDVEVGRITATKYLEELAKAGIVQKHKVGRTNFYLNEPLFALLSR